MSNMQRRDFVRHVGVAGLLGLGAAPFAFAAVKPDARSARHCPAAIKAIGTRMQNWGLNVSSPSTNPPR